MLDSADARRLEAALRPRLDGEVRFDGATRALYATDASNYRQVPIGVVTPRHEQDVIAAVEIARASGAPVLARGGGTSLAGQCCNVALVLDFSRHMRGIVALDPDARTATVQPGVVLDDLRARAEQHGLTFGPDPATHDRCTLGGMIGNNSCGVHSIMAGRTVDNVEALDVLTYDGARFEARALDDAALGEVVRAGGRRGEIHARLRALRDRHADAIRARFPAIPRRVSGYNLDELLPERGFHVARALVGTEGTCVTVLGATLRLVPSPRARALVLLAYPDPFVAADAVPEVLACGPVGLEGFDRRLVDNMRTKGLHLAETERLPAGGCWLLAEFGGDDEAEAAERAHACAVAGATERRVLVERAEQARVWRLRDSALGATAVIPGEPESWEGWEDAAVAPDRLGPYLRAFDALMTEHGYRSAMYGHFGDGCVHFRIDFDLVTTEGIARMRAFVEEAADLVVAHGGSLSGEHGDGQARAELLPRMFGDEIVGAFRDFKAIWDPDGGMNPGKVVDPRPLDADLRLGPGHEPARPETHFAYADDDGSFGHALLRCVGVGACRREHGGTMCPSYRATGEERHSTRGRAHLLWEMLHGDLIADGWRDEAVKEALDLCLACKACKRECPVGVDMASYKAEFLARYWEGRRRPLAATAFGRIARWAPLAARVPRLANALAPLGKPFVGVARERTLPRLAPRTFRRSLRGRARSREGRRVVLWPDTFHEHFHPDTALAAVDALEALGFAVEVPDGALCCGRPLFDWGLLDEAAATLRRALDALEPALRADAPVVVLEPSCLSVFHDELRGLLPDDERAARLADRATSLDRFVREQAPDVELPRRPGRVLLQGHCHRVALDGVDDAEALLGRLGREVARPEAGCCGMAGAFGYGAREYPISLAIGERALLPAVRGLPDGDEIVADGFSCREQIRQATGREARHLADLLAQALRSG